MENLKESFLHDHFFKESMERVQIAQGFARLILSEKIPLKIDYSSLTIEKETWINSMLMQHAADVLYRAEIEDTKDQLFLLFEHKSYVDKTAVFQNFRNTSEIIEEEQKVSSPKKIPPIFPIIVYHGSTPWQLDNSITSLFELIEGAEDFIPKQRNIIVDLSIYPDEEIRSIAEVKAFILSLKYSRSQLLLDKLSLITGAFNDCSVSGVQYFQVVMEYLYNAQPQKNRAEFSKQVERLIREGGQNMKKFSSIWEELGYVAGETDQKKRDEELIEKKNEIINRKDEVIEKTVQSLFEQGFSIEKICEITGLSIKEIVKIKNRIN